MLKRIDKELEKKWDVEELGAPNVEKLSERIVLKLSYCTITVSSSYPFNPPILKAKERPIAPLDPLRWSITLMINPRFAKAVPDWNIACLCCESITCPHKWNASHLLSEVAREGMFCDMYMQVTRASLSFPVSLPLDVLEHMVTMSALT